jgi:hypothetical protein
VLFSISCGSSTQLQELLNGEVVSVLVEIILNLNEEIQFYAVFCILEIMNYEEKLLRVLYYIFLCFILFFGLGFNQTSFTPKYIALDELVRGDGLNKLEQLLQTTKNEKTKAATYELLKLISTHKDKINEGDVEVFDDVVSSIQQQQQQGFEIPSSVPYVAPLITPNSSNCMINPPSLQFSSYQTVTQHSPVPVFQPQNNQNNIPLISYSQVSNPAAFTEQSTSFNVVLPSYQGVTSLNLLPQNQPTNFRKF